MQTQNPATGEVIRDYDEHSDSDLRSAIDRTQEAFIRWRNVELQQRAEKVRQVAVQLRKQSAELAAMIVQEMGKPIQQARAEVEKCAVGCDYYADHAADFLTPEHVDTDAQKSYVRFDPLGVVLAVMPWNFPFWQVFRFAAPAMMAGNTIILKHATSVTGCALAIERVIREAGFPPNVLTTVLLNSSRVADVIANPLIRAVTLTGSDAAGRAVAEHAGRWLKKCVLELGGSDPFIVLSDADLQTTVSQAVAGRIQNTGQSCIAAKRFLVEDSIFDRFTDAFVSHMQTLRVGDPADPQTDVGPLARQDLRDDLHRQVEQSVRAGAVVRTGGHAIEGRGWFYQPTVLTEVQPGMPAFDEELFGPVAAVTRVKDADEAVKLANQSEFGLGASVWTRDTQRGEELAAGIESGCVFVNGIVKSDPRVPFGGVRNSGYGRELSHYGIREFVNIKTVWVT